MHRFKIGFLSFTAMLLTASWLYAASFEQAMEQYKSKKWAQAADAFESVYKDAKQKDDTGNKAFRYMVNALLMDQTPNSLTRLTELAREWPDNIFVQQKYAFAMMFINEWSQAIALLKEIRNKGDNSSVTLAGIAVSHYNAGNYLQAHAFFKELVLLKKRAGWEYMVQLSCCFTGTCTPSPPPSGDLTIETLLAQVGAGLSFESAMEKTRDFDFDPEDTRYLEFAAGEYARFKGDQKTARQHLESAHKGFADAPGFMTMLTRSGLDKLDQSRTADTASKKVPNPSSAQSRPTPSMSPAEGPFIDTDLANGLIEAEAAAKNDPGNAENWIAYARKLLHLPRVFDAQVTAETAALIAMETDSSLTDTANLIRLQAMVNRLEFDQAARLGRQIIDKDPIFINQMDFLNAYISSHALAGDIEAAITQVYALIIQEPSLYGGHAAMIELLRIQRQEQPSDSARIAALISEHRKKLTDIYHQFSRKLEPAMGSYIEKLVKGGAA